jgi:type IV secretory pathway TraG/TraD family ATPase VirD4
MLKKEEIYLIAQLLLTTSYKLFFNKFFFYFSFNFFLTLIGFGHILSKLAELPKTIKKKIYFLDKKIKAKIKSVLALAYNKIFLLNFFY